MEKTYLQRSAENAEKVYRKIVELRCVHEGAQKDIRTYDQMVTKKAVSCTRGVSIILQLSGCLDKGKLVGHTSATKNDGANKKKRSDIMYGEANLKHCRVYDVNCMLSQLPARFIKSGVVMIQNSNIFVCDGRHSDGKIWFWSTNGENMTKLSDGKSHYCNYSGIHRTNGYPAGAKIRVGIVPDGLTDTHLAVECFLGLHGNGAARRKDLGTDYNVVQKIVNELAKDEKRLLWAMADYVLNDYAGNGQARIDLLKEYYEPVQELVNRAVEAAKQICSKDNPYGNGDERIRKLTEAGLDYAVVQGYINRNIDELLRR